MPQSAMLVPSDFASVAAYVNAVKALGDPPAHGNVPEMAAEHAALFHLVDRDQATHVAVKDGSWFDPGTWYDGQIPSAGAKVLIPEAITVNYEGVSDTSLFTVRIDGNLLFATDHNTRMVLDTMVVAKTGHLQIGTSDHPVQDGVTADIVIANNGPIDVKWDPLLLSRGIISHGNTDIHGQEKTSFLKLATDPRAGDTTLVLEQNAAYQGWHVGDKIVVTGTHIVPVQYVGDTYTLLDQGTQDEVITITSMNGSTITLDRPLSYDHDTPKGDLKGYVADYTRNVVVETQNADDVPVSERGHLMFMHNPHVDIEYAELSGLGRTDKSIRAVDAASVLDIASDTNVKGRYALHLHETGVAPGSAEATVKGNAVWGSPGWGIVEHGSSANIENNATYNTFGAAYVSETGDETGTWRNNIAIRAHGVGAGSSVDANGDDVAAFDMGRTGVGFWLQGRLINVEHNIAVGVNEGFVYSLEGSHATVDSRNIAQPESLHGLTSVNVDVPAIRGFVNNEAFATSLGFIAYRPTEAQGHDVRSVVDGFKAWEVDTGVELHYSAHYTVLNAYLTGTARGREGEVGLRGIEIGANSYDIVINKAIFANFTDGIDLTKAVSGNISADGLSYVFIDISAHNILNETIKNFDPASDKLMTADQLGSGPAELHLNFGSIPVWSFSLETGRQVIFEGTKTDSIGTVQYALEDESFTIGQAEMSGLLSHQGYYTTNDGQKIVVVTEYFSDRATGEIYKTAIPMQLAEDVPLVKGDYFLEDGDAKWLGTIDLNRAAPVTHDASAATAKGEQVVIDVLAKDFDPNGLMMFVDEMTQPKHGDVHSNGDGTVTYAPAGDFTGSDIFKLWVTDHNGNFTPQTVTVWVENSGDTLQSSHYAPTPSSQDQAARLTMHNDPSFPVYNYDDPAHSLFGAFVHHDNGTIIG